MWFCLAKPVVLASLCLGERRRSSAVIAGQGTGAACGALPTQEELCISWTLHCWWELKPLNQKALWIWTLCLLIKRQIFVRNLSLPLVVLHMQSLWWLRLVRRSKMKGCVGNFRVSWCTPAPCWPCRDSSSETHSNKAEAVPKTITTGSQHRYGWPQHSSNTTVEMQGNTGARVSVCQSLLVQDRIPNIFLLSVGQSPSKSEKLK